MDGRMYIRAAIFMRKLPKFNYNAISIQWLFSQ